MQVEAETQNKEGLFTRYVAIVKPYAFQTLSCKDQQVLREYDMLPSSLEGRKVQLMLNTQYHFFRTKFIVK